METGEEMIWKEGTLCRTWIKSSQALEKCSPVYSNSATLKFPYMCFPHTLGLFSEPFTC